MMIAVTDVFATLVTAISLKTRRVIAIEWQLDDECDQECFRS